MKKSQSIFLVLLLMSSISFVHAKDDPGTSMAVLKKGTTVKLFYKGAEQSNVKVLILNDLNKIVFSEKIKNTDGFVRPYNFSSLPEGNYSIQLINNAGSQIKEVSYTHESASNSTREKVMHVTHMHGSTNKFVLSVPNVGADELTVTIYNDSNEILYVGKENIVGDFAKIYNLQNYNGKVKFVVTDSNGHSAKTVQDM